MRTTLFFTLELLESEGSSQSAEAFPEPLTEMELSPNFDPTLTADQNINEALLKTGRQNGSADLHKNYFSDLEENDTDGLFIADFGDQHFEPIRHITNKQVSFLDAILSDHAVKHDIGSQIYCIRS